MPDKAMGRLLPFARSAEEVRGLANRQQAHGNPVKAIELLRLSLAKAPEDKDTLLAMAETYASIGCWTLSNSAYFSLIQDEEYAAASFYNLGVNFSTMQVDSLAHDCLVLSIQNDPEGEHVPDAVELLDSIDEAHSITDPLETRIQSRMERVLTAMDAGNAQLATRLVRRVLSIDKHNSGVHSIHSYALLASGDAMGALKAARKAYKLDREDVRALCAMASALHASQSMEASRKYLERALALIEQPDDAQLVCQTACESGQHDVVVTLLQRVEHNVPYSDEVLYPLAVALYNCGETEEALRRWRLMRRIDPMDTVVSYWLDMVEEGNFPGTIPYLRQVPLSEILLRLENLRIWVHEGNDKLKQRWRESDAMEALVRWGLTCGEQGIPQAMCSILTSIGDEKAKGVLCEVLYDINIPH